MPTQTNGRTATQVADRPLSSLDTEGLLRVRRTLQQKLARWTTYNEEYEAHEFILDLIEHELKQSRGVMKKSDGTLYVAQTDEAFS